MPYHDFVGKVKNIKVSVELFGVHRELARVDRLEFPVAEKSLVRDALKYLRGRYPAIVFEEHSILVTVNHEIAALDAPLKADDTICILPHIGGG